jgi:AraC-like DNA-binding protein
MDDTMSASVLRDAAPAVPELSRIHVHLSAYLPHLLEPDIIEGPDAAQLQAIAQRIADHLGRKRAYSEPSLTAMHIAKALGTNTTYLSRAVRKGFHLTLRELLNHIRIAVVLERLQRGTRPSNTIEGIAREAGYAERSTFYRAFREITGMTPGAYIGMTMPVRTEQTRNSGKPE